MIVKLLMLSILLMFLSCSNVSDCTKSSGELTTRIYDDFIFDKILVFKGINLRIIQSSNYRIEVQAGVNLIDDISVTVVNGQLQLRDNTTCNWVRDYGETVITIFTPTLS